MRLPLQAVLLSLALLGGLTCCGTGVPVSRPTSWVTNVTQFHALTGADFLEGCNFHLTGVITLVDAKRDLVVLQDATGAVALNFPVKERNLRFGELVTLDGTNCCPLFATFPDYPCCPSGWDIQSSFDAPMNWGEYHLTWMRGFLCPPVTGEYRFWIASDNSSELWLSTDTSRAKTRKIASIPRFGWTAPHEWTRFPSQRSELISLKAGEIYYIEALQEQTDQAENVSVAWQIPTASGPAPEVIAGRYLTPWNLGHNPNGALTNGILREYWTNYTVADLDGVAGPRPFDSALSVEYVAVTDRGQGQLPPAERISIGQPLPAADNYRWVQTEGMVRFKAMNDSGGILEISDGVALAQVRISQLNLEQLRNASNLTVRVEGVCEGTHDQNNGLVPYLIWVPAKDHLTILENAATNTDGLKPPESTQSAATGNTNPATQGFYLTKGVVTFNDRVFGKNYVFIEEDSAVMLIDIANRPFKSQMQTGRRVDLAGALEPAKNPPVITPLFVTDLGPYPLPQPIIQPLHAARTGNLEGKWSELEGVVHAVKPDGTLSLTTKDGVAFLWVGHTASNHLAGYVDAKLRARGVLRMHLLDAPALLVPSRDFVDVLEPQPEKPYAVPSCPIASLHLADVDTTLGHRVRISGEVIYEDSHSFFIQDASGGIRVQTFSQLSPKTGETIEVVAFPTQTGSALTLTEPLMRPATSADRIRSSSLDLGGTLTLQQKGSLVHVAATLLAEKNNANVQMLELQEQERMFVATLPADRGHLPELLPGSRLRITGVCDDGIPAARARGEKSTEPPLLSSLNILLRNPQDVTLLSGPPWWTWKKTATLVVTLLAVLTITLLWIQLLHRRLVRQQAARLAFSRLVFERLEDERRRIAVNLHDSLGQTLLLIKNNAILANEPTTAGPETRSRLDEISGTTTQAIEEVRRITHGLRPYQLDRLGLSQAIRTMVNQAAENSHISFACRVEDVDGQFDKDAEMHVYRIVQEAVNNVVKHSAATESAVVIKKRATTVSLSIRDNGKGFDPVKLSSRPLEHGFGLTGIGERVLILKGTLHVDSKPAAGTSLTVEIPFKNS